MRIIQAAIFASILFMGVILCLRGGWRLGRARLTKDGEQSIDGLGAIEGAIYALMGLLIAFTFTGAAQRFDHRRDLITDEINAIGTAWLMLDMLDADTRADVRSLIKRYVDTRIEGYAHASDNHAVAQALADSASLQNEIWQEVVAAARADPSPRTATSVLPSINDMFDLATTRWLTTRQHPPVAVYLMLAVLVLVSSLLAGFGMAKSETQSIVHVIGFATILSLSVYLIIDLEFPRLGLLRVDQSDQAFTDLRRTMN